MKIIVPDYFEKFKCIADKCLDSCCIGWEIVIDEKSKAKYSALDCEIGKEIAVKTQHGCFPLEENGRCAFLDENGLCRIISKLGEAYLCDICREHPRYYGVGGNGIEGGIGLGCEAAARIILSLSTLPKLVEAEREISYSDEDEYAEISEYFRDNLYASIFTHSPCELVEIYTAYASVADGVSFDVCTTGEKTDIPEVEARGKSPDEVKALIDAALSILSECEALSDEWPKVISRAKKLDSSEIVNGLSEARGPLYYFTHRYVREGVEDMSIGQRILFALLSALAVVAISKVLNTDEPLVRAAVLYSKNVEYSTDNVDYIYDRLSEFL